MTEPRTYSHDELATALANLEWLVRNRDATFHPPTDTVVCGDGGFGVESLLDPDLTPAAQETIEQFWAEVLAEAAEGDPPEATR